MYGYKKKKNGLPLLSKRDIEEIAAANLREFNEDLLKEPVSIPIEEFLENHLKLYINYADITDDRSILGLTVFNNGHLKVYDLKNKMERVIYVKAGTVIIDNSLLESRNFGRYRFTCGHEGGHWILHRDMFKYESEKMTEAKTDGHFFKTDADWMEWQADYIASCLLMPRKTFTMAAREVLAEAGRKCKDIFEYKNYVLKKMSDIFQVSVQAAYIRLKELKLINLNYGG